MAIRGLKALLQWLNLETKLIFCIYSVVVRDGDSEAGFQTR